jgi:hypothetical protein
LTYCCKCCILITKACLVSHRRLASKRGGIMSETQHVRDYLERQIASANSSLKQYLRQRSQAEDNIARLTETLELLEGTLDYLKQAEDGKEGVAPRIEEEAERTQPYADMTMADAAYEILKTAEGPLHVTRIWKRLQAGGKSSQAEKPVLSVTAALLRDERFENLGKNMFTIRELPSDQNES